MSLLFVDGPYGMNKYPGDSLDAQSLSTYEQVFRFAAGHKIPHLIVCGRFSSLALISTLVPADYQFKTDIVWHKPDWTGGGSSTFAPRHELLLHYALPESKFYADAVRQEYGERASKGVNKKAGRSNAWVPNPLGARRSDVWTITSDRLASKVDGRTQPNKHPCVKPQELLRLCVEATTLPGELVHEPYVGSDSLKLACESTGRTYVGWSDARNPPE